MNYYNEFDKNAAAWLRELIKQGLIPNGDVDERSIKDVRANDLRGYTQCHFFAGIGGWSYALQLAGWPADRPVWTGSCPCQCYSVAGKQLGVQDERDLWPVFFELIRECKPEFVFGEQVENAIKHGWLDRVYTDLEAENYTCRAVVLGAHSVNAPHQRQRLYWGGARLADTKSLGRGAWRPESERNSTVFLCDDGGVSNSEREQHQGGLSESRVDYSETCNRTATKFTGRGDVLQCRVDDSSSNRLRGRNELTVRQGELLLEGSICDSGGLADDTFIGEPARVSGQEQGKERESGEPVNGGLPSFSPWSESAFILCTDGKVRMVPAESLLFSVADGLSKGVDGCGVVCISEDGGFPLTTKKKGRSMLLKGYGNAIVPQLAAEFITAFMEASK